MKDNRDQRDFFEKVFAVVRLVPYGKVTSYGAVARYLGAGSSARTVGWAMNMAHHLKEPVPAHRVVNRNGLLTGKHHFETPETMERLLTEEGITVINDAIQNFEQHYWDPNLSLVL
jgi:methylated-DNA-protein-cysteine methyltransferase related protein